MPRKTQRNSLTLTHEDVRTLVFSAIYKDMPKHPLYKVVRHELWGKTERRAAYNVIFRYKRKYYKFSYEENLSPWGSTPKYDFDLNKTDAHSCPEVVRRSKRVTIVEFV